MSTPEVPASSAPARKPFLWFMLAAVALYAAGVGPHWRFQRDSALYMGLARSLAETGTYSFNYVPHTLALPGFPAMLSLIYVAFGENFLAMNVLVSLCGLGCIAAACLVFRELSLSGRQLAACVLLFGLSRTLYYYSTHVTTDVPFTLFALLGLYCGLRMLRAPGRESWFWSVAAGLAACAATSVRPFGPAVLIALMAGLWLRGGSRRDWKANAGKTLVLIVPLGVAGAAWAVRCARVRTPGSTDYVHMAVGQWGLAGASRHAVGQVLSLVQSLTDAVLGVHMSARSETIIGAFLLLLMAAGLVASLRRGERMLSAFAVLSAGGSCLGSPGRRYLLPVLPVMVYWLVLGADALGRWLVERRGGLSVRGARPLGYGLLAAALSVNLARIGKVVYEERSPDFYAVTEDGRMVDYFKLIGWLEANAPHGSQVMAYEARLLHYFTRLKTWPLRERQLDAAAGRWPPLYVVYDPEKDKGERGLLESMEAQPDRFERVATFGPLVLMMVRPSHGEVVRSD
jgi:4-amino-4-deoxy-L-arabinose transferase-like glycosyltransferase